jgi:hypothetical protein
LSEHDVSPKQGSNGPREFKNSALRVDKRAMNYRRVYLLLAIYLLCVAAMTVMALTFMASHGM